jgi:prepilin-type N-terminal cleavage/methylation domain-containing protein
MKTNRQNGKRGYTLVELTAAMAVGLAVAAMTLSLAMQQFSFLRIFRAQEFLTYEGPVINNFVVKLVSQADGFRIHQSVGDAESGVSPVLEDGSVLVLIHKQSGRRSEGVGPCVHGSGRSGAGLVLLFRGVGRFVRIAAVGGVVEAGGSGVFRAAGNPADATDRPEWRRTHLLGGQPAMNARIRRPGFQPGYISYAVVLSLGVVLLLMMAQAYRSALQSQDTQADTQLRIDYRDKEDAVLRGIVNLLPNRAMRAMQHQSNANNTNRRPMRWKLIFKDSLTLANARTSAMEKPSRRSTSATCRSPTRRTRSSGRSAGSSMRSSRRAGLWPRVINRSLGLGFPGHLATENSTVASRDRDYPIITFDKTYPNGYVGIGGVTSGDYPMYNVIPYPDIRFGYAKPGEPFVAKRNWWAFSMDLADHDDNLTGYRALRARLHRLALRDSLAAGDFRRGIHQHRDARGRHQSWQNTSIDGGVFAAAVKSKGR